MRIKNLPSIESMDGSQDALVIEQTDGSEDKSRKVSPAQIKQYVLNDMDEVPTQNSNNPVKSGGIFSTMAVPKYDAANRREYYEGGGAFGGNIDSTPTAGSNNAVASGGTKTYVDNLVSPKINKTSIQSSKAAFPPAAVGVQTVTVTFPTAFAHTPQVMVSWDDNQSLPSFFKYPLHIAGITTTGFTVQAERLNESANWWFRYIAVDNQ